MNQVFADAASTTKSRLLISSVQRLIGVGLSLAILLILTPSLDGKGKKSKSGSASSRKQERSISDFIGSGSVTKLAYTNKKNGSEILVDVTFGQCEPNTLPEYIINISGNMSIQEYEGRKYLFCYGECVFALDLHGPISDLYSFEISESVQREDRIRQHRSGVEVAFLSSVEANKGAMRSGSDAYNSARLNITSENCSVPTVVEGNTIAYFKGTQEGVREASYSILEGPVSYSFVRDPLYVRAFRGPYQVLVAPAKSVPHDNTAKYCVVKVRGERGPHGDVPLMIGHINVAALTTAQSLEILRGYEDCANRGVAESPKGPSEVLFREDFESWCVGTVPAQTGFSVTSISNAVVSWEGRHTLASLNGSHIEIALPEILPESFVIEFGLGFIESTDRSPVRTASLRAWRSRDPASTKINSNNSPPRCECSRVYLSERGSSGFASIPGGSSQHTFSLNQIVRCRLQVDGSNLQLYAGSDQIAIVTNGCWVGFNCIGIEINNGIDAPVLLDDLSITR